MLIDDFALGWIYGRLVYRYWTIVVFFLPLPVLHLSPFQLTLLLGLHLYFKHCRWKNFPGGHCTPNGDKLVWLCFANTNTVKRHCCTIQFIALYTDFFSLILWEGTAGRAIPGLGYILCYAKTRSMAEVTLESLVL